jgi:hypothetical protein
MDPTVVAAWSAAGVSVLTLIGTVITQVIGFRSTKADTEQQIKAQSDGDLAALDAPLTCQPGQLGGFLVGGCQQQRDLALGGVGQPQVDRAVVDAVLGPS